jgi:hypothetical protein
MEGSGVDYPTIEIEGQQYTLKFSRGAMYLLDKQGVDFRRLGRELQMWLPRKEVPGSGQVHLSGLVDVIHACLAEQFPGVTAARFADMLLPIGLQGVDYQNRVGALAIAVIQALGKAWPPSQALPLQETAATQERPN